MASIPDDPAGETPVTGVIPEQQLRSLLAVHGSWFLNKHLFISD